MSRNAAAEASLRGRLEAMFVAAGDNPASVRDVIVADRESANAFMETPLDAEWFAFFTQENARRFCRITHGCVFVAGATPEDAAAKLVGLLRQHAERAAVLARATRKSSREDAEAFGRVADLCEVNP